MHSEHDLKERQRRTNHSESFPLWGHNPPPTGGHNPRGEAPSTFPSEPSEPFEPSEPYEPYEPGGALRPFMYPVFFLLF